ncbi:FeoB-associated Cys-rich membrane protein [Lacrimispora indolis]|uniref:FeoB-associated Cys-rich membrane protein n=1 Tax=Lacrimispora indolis TaxID=69825 RepID=UPI0003F5F8E5|nr:MULTISPECIES: FeoB-associated Cys-rich membrane protein [Lachnospiraceae]MBE7722216.1 FeoB-associated Cys-rich membrane protein [Lacrimispora celerecrescens]
MPAWLASNGSTVIIAMILLVLVCFSVRKFVKNKGKGGCGCGHCSGGCSNCAFRNFDEEKKES